MSFPAGVYNVSGGGLNDVYTTVQFHFHFGPNNTVGSEHIVDGEHYAAEVSYRVSEQMSSLKKRCNEKKNRRNVSILYLSSAAKYNLSSICEISSGAALAFDVLMCSRKSL